MPDQIEMSLYNDRVSITFQPEVKAWTKTRNISLSSALEVASILMRSGTLLDNITLEGDPEFVVQVGEGTEKQAWLGISAWGYQGDPDLVAYVRDDTVQEIGRCLHNLWLWHKEPEQMPKDQQTYIVQVLGFRLKLKDVDEYQLLCDVISLYP